MALGGGKYTSQNKVLPGAYINFASPSVAAAAVAERGVAAMPIELDWGADGEVFRVDVETFNNDCLKIFGYERSHDKMKPLRDLFRGAKTAFLYRLNGGVAAFCEYATAKYKGTRGNDIRIVIQKNVDDQTKYDVETYLGNVRMDTQRVTAMTGLKDNDYVTFKTDATIAEVAGVSLTGGTNKTTLDTADYQGFLDKIESYSFNVLACATSTAAVNALFVAFTKRMRDDNGIKFQTVLYKTSTADYEGVISVENTASPSTEPAASLVYWVAGAEASCDISKTITNKAYDGEYGVDTDYTQAQLEAGIAAGKLMLHNASGSVRVLSDVNTFVSFTEEKTSDFAQNQVIRVIDDIANTIAAIFNQKYLGNVTNNASGRISLWNDVVKRHKELESAGAIENFNVNDVKIKQGETNKSVVVNEVISVANSMAQLYMSVIVSE